MSIDNILKKHPLICSNKTPKGITLKPYKMNKETFLTATINNISKMYEGAQKSCRCGCRGEYYHTSFIQDEMQSKFFEINDELILSKLETAKKLIKSGATFIEGGDQYFEVSTGENRCLTFFFDELK